MRPTPEFEQLARLPAGLNGGNPSADLWFCGIEFGDRVIDQELRSSSSTPVASNGFPHFTAEFVTSRRLEQSPFLQKMCRVVHAYDGKPIGTISEVQEDIRNRLLAADGAAFHLNLYPLAFRNAADDAFGPAHQAATGFPHKTLYRAWCMEFRFPELRSLVRQFRPKVLLCVGTSFRADYRLAFLGPEAASREPDKIIVLESAMDKPSKNVEVYRDVDGTLVAIAPFLGQGGLMASAHLHQLGVELRNRSS